MTSRGDKSIGDSAADDQAVDDFCERIEHRQFGRDFRAADNCDKRPRRIVECFRKCLELRCEQGTRAGNWCKFGNAVGTCLGTVCRTERIHDENITQCCHFLGECGLGCFFPNQKPNILKQHNITRRDIDPIDPVFHQRHGAIKQCRQTIGDRLQ